MKAEKIKDKNGNTKKKIIKLTKIDKNIFSPTDFNFTQIHGFDKLLFARDFFSISKTTKHKIKAERVSIIAKVEASEKFKVFFTA